MSLFFEGIKLGLILTILLGPIFFTLIQTGVEQGLRAGAMVGLGIWASDILFVSSVYLGISYVNQVVEWKNFPFYLGTLGSIILLAYGIGTLLAKPPSFDIKQSNLSRYSPYSSLWLKGFLINSLNPFTFFFWIGVVSTIVVDGNLNGNQALLFFVGIIGTIIITDLAKVVLAKRIRNWMRIAHIVWIRRISGIALLIFGLILFVRVLFLYES